MGKLIDADALIEALGITDMNCEKCAWYSGIEWNPCKRGSDFEQACFTIENAPEAIIRCKDCIFYASAKGYSFGICEYFGRDANDADYCNSGERRTDE